MVDKKRNPSDAKQLFKTVVEGGYCIGCGACASINDSPVGMKLNEYGLFQATLQASEEDSSLSRGSLLAVCPFSGESSNEDEIASELFQAHCQHHERIGYYLTTYAGYVCEHNFREQGSSGGLGTWLAVELLRKDLGDGVIHVHQRLPTEDDSRLFHYRVSTSVDAVCGGSKSRYYPIEMSEIIRLVRAQPGRYAITGVPCFIKAVRLLMRRDAVIAERIRFCIGLICGHLKSTKFAEMLAWQLGYQPDTLTSFDFRKKISNAAANRYGVEVTGRKEGCNSTCIAPIHDLYGRDWGLGFFKYKACDYCDDVVAETADVVVGDAWLPQYVEDSRGTNVLVVRHPVILQLVTDGIEDGRLRLDLIDASEVARSQESGLRHRREGLAYRLHLADRRGDWYPSKRVSPDASHLTPRLQKQQVLRIALAEKSHLAFRSALAENNFSVFVQQMKPLVEEYMALYQKQKLPIWKQFIRRAKAIVKQLIFSRT